MTTTPWAAPARAVGQGVRALSWVCPLLAIALLVSACEPRRLYPIASRPVATSTPDAGPVEPATPPVDAGTPEAPTLTLAVEPIGSPATRLRLSWAGSGCSLPQVTLRQELAAGVRRTLVTASELENTVEVSSAELSGFTGPVLPVAHITAELRCWSEGRTATAEAYVSDLVRGELVPWAVGSAPAVQPEWLQSLEEGLLVWCTAAGPGRIEVIQAEKSGGGMWQVLARQTVRGSCSRTRLVGQWLLSAGSASATARAVPLAQPWSPAPTEWEHGGTLSAAISLPDGDLLAIHTLEMRQLTRVSPSGEVRWIQFRGLDAESTLHLEGRHVVVTQRANTDGPYSWAGATRISLATGDVDSFSFWYTPLTSAGRAAWVAGALWLTEPEGEVTGRGLIRCIPGEASCSLVWTPPADPADLLEVSGDTLLVGLSSGRLARVALPLSAAPAETVELAGDTLLRGGPGGRAAPLLSARSGAVRRVDGEGWLLPLEGPWTVPAQSPSGALLLVGPSGVVETMATASSLATGMAERIEGVPTVAEPEPSVAPEDVEAGALGVTLFVEDVWVFALSSLPRWRELLGLGDDEH